MESFFSIVAKLDCHRKGLRRCFTETLLQNSFFAEHLGKTAFTSLLL